MNPGAGQDEDTSLLSSCPLDHNQMLPIQSAALFDPWFEALPRES